MPERDNSRERARLAKLITDPDMIVSEVEKKRCIESVKAWQEQMLRWRDAEPSPSLGAALMGGYHWLDVYCRGCRQVATITLSKANYHPQTSLTAIVARWECDNCQRDGPAPAIKSIRQQPPETAAQYAARKAAERESDQGFEGTSPSARRSR
jgi:hypothetical protein